jgi:hypothetical protein
VKKSVWLALAVWGVLAGKSRAEEPRWLTDYDEARKVARKSEKPLFVVFRCEH